MASDGGAIIGKILASRGVKHLFTLCGGHTEMTYQLPRAIVVGQILGEVARDR